MWLGMQCSRKKFVLVKQLFPIQRGNVRIDNLTFANAILIRRRERAQLVGLSARHGRWQTVYTRMRR